MISNSGVIVSLRDNGKWFTCCGYFWLSSIRSEKDISVLRSLPYNIIIETFVITLVKSPSRQINTKDLTITGLVFILTPKIHLEPLIVLEAHKVTSTPVVLILYHGEIREVANHSKGDFPGTWRNIRQHV